MTANRIITDHQELDGIGQLTHDQIDKQITGGGWIIVSGSIASPAARTLKAGPGLTITDGGPGGTVIVSVTSVATGSTISWMERPVGTADGINHNFTLANLPSPAAAVMFYVGGLLQEQGVGNDYTLSGSVIHVLYQYRSGSNLRATYPY